MEKEDINTCFIFPIQSTGILLILQATRPNVPDPAKQSNTTSFSKE